MSSSDRRDDSRLEVDDHQHCKGCGLEIEIDTDGPNGIRWDPFAQEWVAIEQCAAYRAEELLEHVNSEHAGEYQRDDWPDTPAGRAGREAGDEDDVNDQQEDDIDG